WPVVDMPASVAPHGGGDEPEALPHETAVEENAVATTPPPDMEETQVIPSITEVESVANGRHHAEAEEPATFGEEPEGARDTDTEDDAAAASMEETQVIPAITGAQPVVDEPTESAAEAGGSPPTAVATTRWSASR
ncbi:MAG: hypothetical protein ACXVX5_14155, partial [Mycobacterium sp.]